MSQLDRSSPAVFLSSFVEAFDGGHIDGLLGYYSADAVIDVGGGAVARGREQIRIALESFLAPGRRLKLKPRLIETVGDTALVMMNWAIEEPERVQRPAALQGRAIHVLGRTGPEDWRLRIDIPFSPEGAPVHVSAAGLDLPAGLEENLAAFLASFADAFDRNDVSRLAAHYAPNAVIDLGPGEEHRGQSAIRAVLYRFLTPIQPLRFRCRLATVAGDAALVLLDWDLAGRISGRGLQVLRLADGGMWRIQIDIPFSQTIPDRSPSKPGSDTSETGLGKGPG